MLRWAKDKKLWALLIRETNKAGKDIDIVFQKFWDSGMNNIYEVYDEFGYVMFGNVEAISKRLGLSIRAVYKMIKDPSEHEHLKIRKADFYYYSDLNRARNFSKEFVR